MKKRIIALCLLAVLSLTLFAACGKKAITVEQAQQIALETIGMTSANHIHVDAAEYEGTACYVVHISDGGQDIYVYIDQTGKVLHTDK